MSGLLLTQSSQPIVGQIAWLLGKLMSGIFALMESVFHIQNIALCIIIFTIIIYMLMLPLTFKQQKFSKMSAVMQPEIQKIQKKYKGKKDQASMVKMQEETQMVYQKYGVSMTGGCLQLFIQLPIIWGLYYVIRNIPAYVQGIKDVYMPLVERILALDGGQKVMEKIGAESPVLLDPNKYDYSQANTMVDALYKFTDSTWDKLADQLPSLGSLIDSTRESLMHLNTFLGINIAETPMSLLMAAIKTGAIAAIIIAIAIPVLSAFTQYLSIRLMPSAANNSANDDNQMAASMRTMNKVMPLFSLFFVFTMPLGIGLYWIASAVVRTVQQVLINRHFQKISMDEMIAKNMEKAAKKREKQGTRASKLAAMAQMSAKNIDDKKMSEKEREEKVAKAAEMNKNAGQGSLASKANLVRKYNESDKK